MRYAAFLFLFLVVFACKEEEGNPTVNTETFQLASVDIGTKSLDLNQVLNNTSVPYDQPIVATFSTPIDANTLQSSFKLIKLDNSDSIALTFTLSDDLKTVTAKTPENLKFSTKYIITLKETLLGTDGSHFPGLNISFTTQIGALNVVGLKIDDASAIGSTALREVSLTPEIEVTFSAPVNVDGLTSSPAILSEAGPAIPSTFTWSANNTVLKIKPVDPLGGARRQKIAISGNIIGTQGEKFSGLDKYFYTGLDPNPVMPVISDEELLTLVQQQTFKYFYDFAHPTSGLARERNSSGDIVTTGGSGFGIMALVVGIERGFISRADGIARFNKIVTFLEDADRFHGAWPHWMNGTTGDVVPFSEKDNGGDLVETAFLVQGLLTARQYIQASDTTGNNLINRITDMWSEVEWSWYRKDGENVLYWHWSPTFDWQMNFPLYGYFEEQIAYILAAASPTYPIPKIVYTNGYGRNGDIVSNNTYYDITLPLGGTAPLFWTQYSYLGMDPHFSDDYTDYWTQNTNASKINYLYCVDNPRNYVGYSENNWGLTASDNQDGYNAHSPNNDLGVITPTAALSAFPYTPEESMAALKFFYYNLGDRLWGPYGFYDAFNTNEGWYADSYLAIDQGPIVVMIENYRTGLLWNLFMSSPEMTQAKDVLDLH